MIAMTAITFERGALIKVIHDLETTLRTLQMRDDAHSNRVRPVLEERLNERKRELIWGY